MRLLVPTDFSPNAQKALDFAVRIAEKSGGEIVLLHAHQVIDTTSVSRKLLFDEYNYSVAKKLHDELQEHADRLAKSHPHVRITAEFADKDAKKAIAESGANADLVVMGTQGASGIERLFMGSVTASVIGNADVPVLAIPRLFEWKEPKRLLFATNRFETDAAILDHLFRMTNMFGAALHVVVFTDTDTARPEHYLSDGRNLEHYHQQLTRRNPDVQIVSAHLQGSEFETTLQQYIDEHAIDMVAMVPYKRNFLQQIFHASVTRKMVYRSSVPLLIIPAPAE